MRTARRSVHGVCCWMSLTLTILGGFDHEDGFPAAGRINGSFDCRSCKIEKEFEPCGRAASCSLHAKHLRWVRPVPAVAAKRRREDFGSDRTWKPRFVVSDCGILRWELGPWSAGLLAAGGPSKEFEDCRNEL